MRAISPVRVRPTDKGWSRAAALYDCAAKAWFDNRPEDKHSVILRAAHADLSDSGYFKPHDGVWPED